MVVVPSPQWLASVDAMRPVFMLVMGLALLLVAWRLTRRTSGWPARTLMAGALLLALGYSVLIPLYEVHVLVPLELIAYFPQADPGTVLGWHLVKILAMNGGWLLFGLGLVLYSRRIDFNRASHTPTFS